MTEFADYKKAGIERVRQARDRTSVHLGVVRVPLPAAPPPSGADLIAAERIRMIQEGAFTDVEQHGHGHDLYLAALALLDYIWARGMNPYAAPEQFPVPPSWPWSASEWKPSEDVQDNLVRAGGLIAASLDRLRG